MYNFRKSCGETYISIIKRKFLNIFFFFLCYFFFVCCRRKFIKKPMSATQSRTFVEFVLEPLYKIFSQVNQVN